MAGKTLHISRFALSLRAVIRYCLRMYSWALSDAAPTERCAGHCKNGVSKSLSTMHHARTVSCLPRRYIPKHRIHTAMLAQISIDKVTCSGCSLGMVGSILCTIELIWTHSVDMFLLTSNLTEVGIFHLIACNFCQASNQWPVACASRAMTKIRPVKAIWIQNDGDYLTVFTPYLGKPLVVLNAGANIVPSSSARVRNISSLVSA